MKLIKYVPSNEVRIHKFILVIYILIAHPICVARHLIHSQIMHFVFFYNNNHKIKILSIFLHTTQMLSINS